MAYTARIDSIMTFLAGVEFFVTRDDEQRPTYWIVDADPEPDPAWGASRAWTQGPGERPAYRLVATSFLHSDLAVRSQEEPWVVWQEAPDLFLLAFTEYAHRGHAEI